MKRNRVKIITVDLIKTAVVFLLTTLLSLLIVEAGGQNYSVTALYVMAVVLCSLLTSGYVYGIITALVGVIAINYFFMYPYWGFDFTASGYPLTLFVLVVISIMSSYVVDHYTTLKQEQLKIENEREIEKTKSELLRFLSHDLRTPLTTILSATSLYRDNEGLSEDTKNKLVEDIEINAKWQLDMVENLLMITRVVNASENIQLQEELTVELIETVIAREKQLHPDIVFDVKLWEEVLVVNINVMLMEQVLVNLIENAYKYGGESHIVEIETKLIEDKVQILVKDQGDGLSSEEMKTLFNQEILKKEGNRKEGLGIGLYLCDKIMRAHKGRIFCRNRKERGACFVLELPAVLGIGGVYGEEDIDSGR